MSTTKGTMDDEYVDLINKKAATVTEIALENAKNYLLDMHLQARENTNQEVKDIQWTSSKDFTIDLGIRQIEEYILTWEMSSRWLHCTDFIEEEVMEGITRYHYRVKWSIPTRRKPVPRSTACVYFIVDVFTNKSQNMPIQVCFFVESNQLMHRPGQSRFREKWLTDVIESKIHLMQEIIF
ncbi:A-kinase anchor protein 14-like isoform X2 [Polypterus senegalus]|uniref:A-kinase anchor protein 14-like isoform X2 n=1 Tax=Polypterus senegalus TaxID=55291 RepID=UPI0019662682|nr:A-kinase anchor protein 14-like isoform X2 [Polypterus senegalus]